MATAKTSYIDENGVKQPGYIKDGGIYADYLTKTANGSGGIYADYLKKVANDSGGIYSAFLQKNAEDVQGQMDRLNGQYEQLNTQLYRDYMQRKKNLPQQLAAQGISGGLSETSRLGLEASYQDGLNQNERARLEGIRDIQSAGNSAQLNILQNYWDEESARAAERANVMASIGDFSGYKALGYTDEQIAALKAAWDAEHAPKVRYPAPKPTVELTSSAARIIDRWMQNAADGKSKKSVVLNQFNSWVEDGRISAAEAIAISDKYGLPK